MRPTRRIVLTLACAPAQLLSGALGALVLSRTLRGSASGWGDLIGAVIGLTIGAGAGLSGTLAAAGRARGCSRAAVAAVMVMALPSALLANIIAGLLGLGFPLAAVLYLAGSSVFVWWYSGRESSPT